MKATEITLNPYKITWAIIEPVAGIVTLADQKKIDRTTITSMLWRGERVHRKHFGSKRQAVEYMQSLKGKLSKSYRVTLCTDKQFGMMEWPCETPSFTTKQKSEAFYI